jgi:hypothetical protein
MWTPYDVHIFRLLWEWRQKVFPNCRYTSTRPSTTGYWRKDKRKGRGEIEVTGRRGRRRKKLLDDLKERREYSRLKEKALDRTIWRDCFGRGFGLVVRQTTKWMSTRLLGFTTQKSLLVFFLSNRSVSIQSGGLSSSVILKRWHDNQSKRYGV